jgi:hypothetical protein
VPSPLPETSKIQSNASGNLLEETFSSAPDYTNHWQLSHQKGNASLMYSPGVLRLLANRATSSIGLMSRQSFSGEFDLTVEFNHEGFGRIEVGLYRAGTPVVHVDLDTDDAACLWMAAPGQSIVPAICPSNPFLNRWVTLRIRAQRTQASFYVDETLLQIVPYSNLPGRYTVGFSASSVPWKSGDNQSSFRLIRVNALATERITSRASSEPSPAGIETAADRTNTEKKGPTTHCDVVRTLGLTEPGCEQEPSAARPRKIPKKEAEEIRFKLDCAIAQSEGRPLADGCAAVLGKTRATTHQDVLDILNGVKK